MYLLCDTETTGLPVWNIPADHPSQPRMAELAVVLLNKDLEEIDRFCHLIKPTDWPLDDAPFVANMKKAQEFHGLTLERLQTDGVPLQTARDDWRRLYDQCEFVVGYNVWFDHKIVRGNLRRAGYDIPFRHKQAMDVMKCATEVCKIERKAPGGGYKFPKLGEAVKVMLGREHDKAHSATSDLDATVELFRILHKDGLMVAEDQPEAKNKEPVA